MKINMDELLDSMLEGISNMDYVRSEDIPNIELYMDQVTSFMDEQLSSSKRYDDDKILTKTMINNYAKNNLLPPPVKKKYSKEHMIVLIFIYYFKNILSISEIQAMLNPLTDKFFDPAGNSGKISMEDVYTEVFNAIKSQLSTINTDIETKLEVDKEHFNDVKNKQDREFLQKFSMICMLGFDVFLKKQIIEGLIDTIVSDKEKSEHKEAERKAKKEPVKAPASKETHKK